MNIEQYYNCKELIHMPIWEHKLSNSVILSYPQFTRPSSRGGSCSDQSRVLDLKWK